MGGVPVKRKKRAEPVGGPHTFRSPTAVVVWWIWLLFAAANLVDLAIQGRDHTSLVAAAILVLATGVAYVTALRPRLLADDAGVTVKNPLRDHHIGWAGVTKIDLADLLRVHCDWSSMVGAAPGTRQYTKVITSWAVHYSRRRQLMAEARTRRQSVRANRRTSVGPFSADRDAGSAGSRAGYAGSRPNPADVSAAEAEAERIVKILNEYVNTAHAEVVWAGGTAETAGAGPADQTTGHDVAEGPEASAGLESLRHTGWFEPLKSTWNWPAVAALVIPALILLVVCLV